MGENFFEDFVDWINERSYDELTQTPEYKQLMRQNAKICGKIIERLGGDERLINAYNAIHADMNVRYYYFLCRKVAEAVVKIIANIGLV